LDVHQSVARRLKPLYRLALRLSMYSPGLAPLLRNLETKAPLDSTARGSFAPR
jgi:hypothetical protein